MIVGAKGDVYESVGCSGPVERRLWLGLGWTQMDIFQIYCEADTENNKEATHEG